MAREPAEVLITLTDVELAVRLNALLENAGVRTALVSPLDDVPAEIRRTKPELIVLTGALGDALHVHVVQEALWDGVAVIGLADVQDPQLIGRLRGIGLADVYVKPIAPDDVFAAVRRVLDRHRLAQITGLIGQSEAIREVLVKIEQMAPVSSTVLVEGESGTGKELVARAIHRLSPRRSNPFIAVNVGALPDTLLESELFGHEKGSFTGAAERRIGRFELANTGTLFLDEIGEVPAATQVKLLRVLEDRELMRVGAAAPIKVNVRVVAATNKPLRQCVAEGTFRSDLYYRLNVLNIYLPPLRERRDDIPILVRRFIKEFSTRHDRPFHGISAAAMQLLVEYAWPGNVRELRNLIESMVVLAPGREISADNIPREVRDGGTARFLPVHVGPVVREVGSAQGRELEFIVRSLVELKLQVEELRARVLPRSEPAWRYDDQVQPPRDELGTEVYPTASGTDLTPPGQKDMLIRYGSVAGIEAPGQPPPSNIVTLTPGMTMGEIERAAIEATLRETRGNRRKAAEILGIGERTMYRKLREYQIPDDFNWA